MMAKPLKTIATALVLSFAVQATSAQAAVSLSLCKYLQNTQCDAPVTMLQWILESLLP